MAKQIKVLIIDLTYPDVPMQGEPTQGKTFARELRDIIEAGCAANGMSYSKVDIASGLSHYCAELVFEVS